jgi:hypothetical protein
MYIQRRMKMEGGREIAVKIIFVQICKLKSTSRTDYHARRRYMWNKM